MKSVLRASYFALLVAACSSAGTETGNPPTRNVCPKTCGPCAPPITLTVTDAERGGAVASVSIDEDITACVVGTESTLCGLAGERYAMPGAHTFVVSAKGYESQTVEVQIGSEGPLECCPCGYVATRTAVRLVPKP